MSFAPAPSFFKTFAILGGCFLVFVGMSIANDESGAACDRLAGSPNDPRFGPAGIPQLEIDGAAALDACRKAYADAPDEPRFAFQLARAEQGTGDYQAARHHFAEAAGNGYPLAEVGLGMLFDQGLGGGQDLAIARKHYEAAAERGVGVGIHNLAWLYLDGAGVTKDPGQAAALFRKAIEAGYRPAAGGLAEALHEGWQAGDDPAPVVKAYLDAADGGIGFAHTVLGHFYRDGSLGLPVDLVAASGHYRAGMALGDNWSGLYLAQILAFADRENRLNSEPETILRRLVSTEQGSLKAQAMASLAALLTRRGEMLEAATLVEEAQAIAPSDSTVLSSQAGLLALALQFDEADQLLARAIEQDPDWAPFHAQRADLQLKLGDKAMAARLRESATAAQAGRVFLGPRPGPLPLPPS
ncbi:hypothetical protein AWJ14_07870 [Hoeflea olei]|uniref:Uncharacterized protein n=2 Tax=Hoeflea olei TaxID=1480615 RepID=A0A1C1YU63_9HYPH|nr:hypothetical protein AWJ14_07870 [Hoeflea olei]